MKVPKTIGGGCTDVIEQALSFITLHFAFSQHVEAGGEMLRAVGLLRKVKQPARLRSLMVALKTRGIQRLNRDLLNKRLASAQGSKFRAIMGEGSERCHSKLNVRPVNLPESIKVPLSKSKLHRRGSNQQVGIDVLALLSNEVGVLVFIGSE